MGEDKGELIWGGELEGGPFQALLVSPDVKVTCNTRLLLDLNHSSSLVHVLELSSMTSLGVLM